MRGNRLATSPSRTALMRGMPPATLALADRLGQWTAQHTQETVRTLLQEEHHVSWSVTTIRKIMADLNADLTPLTHEAQVEHLLKLLQQAHDSTGPHRPVLT